LSRWVAVVRENINVLRGLATREHILEVATELFAERGYENTSIDLVLQESGVSRGALYHHFKGKDALFEAVVEALEEDVGQRTLEAAGEGEIPVEALRKGCLAWIRMASEPAVQRILLLDAPAVLGWQTWRTMEERHALGLLKGALSEVADGGGVAVELVDVFAHVLLAGMNEIALFVAQAGDPEAAVEVGTTAVDEILSRLLSGSTVPPT
jgi:AcrR family transcriptional regulator